MQTDNRVQGCRDDRKQTDDSSVVGDKSDCGDTENESDAQPTAEAVISQQNVSARTEEICCYSADGEKEDIGNRKQQALKCLI